MKTCRPLISGAARRLGVLAIGVVLLGAISARADSLQSRQTVVDLIQQADTIIRGDVVELTDGIDENNLPYTQVKVQIKETIRGNVSGEYTFRQFGLLKPRRMENGRLNVMVNPAGWASYQAGEEVVLFLWPQASLSGLRTTVGLKHGKFAIKAGGAMNQGDNEGLFQDVVVDQKLLNDNDKRVMATKKGQVNAEAFVSLVRRAVKDQWIEKGKMRNAN